MYWINRIVNQLEEAELVLLALLFNTTNYCISSYYFVFLKVNMNAANKKIITKDHIMSIYFFDISIHLAKTRLGRLTCPSIKLENVKCHFRLAPCASNLSITLNFLKQIDHLYVRCLKQSPC